MRIALIGYGRMGKAVEKAAESMGHTIVGRHSHTPPADHLKEADVAIEFSLPASAPDNILRCFEASLPVVSGTTGWLNRWDEVLDACRESQGSFFYASNYSIGVHRFMHSAQHQAEVLFQDGGYNVRIEEVHHIHKADAPSGTAITLAEHVLEAWPDKKEWQLDDRPAEHVLGIQAFREGEIPGTHRVIFESEQDSLVLEHQAHGRHGFARGAVKAAEFLQARQGFYTMRDYLNPTA